MLEKITLLLEANFYAAILFATEIGWICIAYYAYKWIRYISNKKNLKSFLKRFLVFIPFILFFSMKLIHFLFYGKECERDYQFLGSWADWTEK